MEILETHEKAEAAHEHDNKRAALLIIVLAALLAIVEIAGKESQYTSLAANIERSDLYTYYQAKTIRSTLAKTAVDGAALAVAPAQRTEDWDRQVATWKQMADTLDSDPKGKEGRKELLEKAKAVEAERDAETTKYHDFEFGSAALQLAIVMASAAVITELAALEIVAAVFGCVGIGLALMGWLAPNLIAL